jgi:cytochrome b subunit of formate dehydrogenase
LPVSRDVIVYALVERPIHWVLVLSPVIIVLHGL